MLQLSEICKMGEDHSRAAELIERTLYAMESAFHPLFNLAVGTSRLDYRRQENRAFFIAIFKHLANVGSRACHRTALEFCKLLLSLDPDNDPMGVLLTLGKRRRLCISNNFLSNFSCRLLCHSSPAIFVVHWIPISMGILEKSVSIAQHGVLFSSGSFLLEQKWGWFESGWWENAKGLNWLSWGSIASTG